MLVSIFALFVFFVLTCLGQVIGGASGGSRIFLETGVLRLMSTPRNDPAGSSPLETHGGTRSISPCTPLKMPN